MSDGGTTPAFARRSAIPCALEKRRGWDATCWTSACFVTAQNGSYPGGAQNATGDSARSRVHSSWG